MEKKDNAKTHFNFAKKFFSQPLKDLDLEALEEVKGELKRAIELEPEMFLAHFYLGRLYLIMKQNEEAEKEFRTAMKIHPTSILAKEYLATCLAINGLPVKSDEKSVRDLFFMFENNIRKFIESRLRTGFGENWMRDGIPPKIRGECAKRREEGLEDEKEAVLLHFADFHDYREIMERNKVLFASNLDIKLWQNRLAELEPIRNALAHSRPISQSAEKKIKDYYNEFAQIAKDRQKINL